MRRLLICVLVCMVLCACDNAKKEERAALLRLQHASELAQGGSWNAAKTELDSVHLLYPRQVAIRRSARQLQDSIALQEALRNRDYADSVLQPLLSEVDEQIKRFRHEKNELYEDNGRYVHRLLTTGGNSSRCFLQTYITDDFRVILKSYYYGSKSLEQDRLELSAEGQKVYAAGENHSFEASGWHEILTVSEEDALNLLTFIDGNSGSRLKVTLHGKWDYVYYLSETEKKALVETRQLAVLMRDVHRLEEMRNISERQITYYTEKCGKSNGEEVREGSEM